MTPVAPQVCPADAIGSWRCTVLFSAAYLACCVIGLSLTYPGEVPFATFWPASGLYVAVLTIAQRRDWPRLIAAAIATNLLFNVVLLRQPLVLSMFYCLANTLEAVIGSGLLRAIRRRYGPVSQLQDFMGLAAAGIVGSASGAGMAMLTTYLSGAAFDADWGVIWWAADMAGILAIGPVVLSWWSPVANTGPTLRSPWRVVELIVLLGLVFARTWTSGRITELSVRALPLGILPLLVWAAVRFGVRGVSLALVMFYVIQVDATINGRGLFAIGNDPMDLRILYLQAAAGFLGFSFISLASVIDDRNRALDDARQLRLAADRANAAKSEFLANMSHELRTPLNGVLGMLEVIGRSELSPLQHQRVGLVRRSANSLLLLLNDILDLSKVEAGRLELRPEVFSLRAAVEETLRLIEPLAQEKGVALICRVSPDTPDRLLADQGRLRQVLLNLLGNAVKFTHEGSIRLEVDVASRTEAVRVLHFCVSDTGIGIAPEVQERLFTRYEQAHSREYSGGTGLGLSIARQLATLMGGRMWMESERGHGSQFHFTMSTTAVEPADEAEVETRHDALDPPVAEAADRTAPAERSVLVVEDDPVSALVVSAVLENAGFKVAIASHGAEAVELWRSGQFQCVLSDMRMPVMDGLELARAIRENELPQGVRTPIIILTASGQPSEREDCSAAGVDAYLTKPLRTDELLGTIERLNLQSPGTTDGE